MGEQRELRLERQIAGMKRGGRNREGCNAFVTDPMIAMKLYAPSIRLWFCCARGILWCSLCTEVDFYPLRYICSSVRCKTCSMTIDAIRACVHSRLGFGKRKS
jgi:hypothetical protein